MEPPERLAGDSWLGVTAFLPDDSGYTGTAMVERLRAALPGCVIAHGPHGVELVGGGWRLWLYESRAVAGDSDWAEYAEVFATHPRATAMAAPGWRLEFAGESVDAGDDGGPAVVAAAAVVASFPHAFTFDGEAECEIAE